MRKHIVPFLFALGLSILVGCQTTPTANQQLAIDTGVNAAVAILIQNGTQDPTIWRARAERTLAIVDQLQTVASSNTVSVSDLLQALSPLLDQAHLQPGERIAANQLIATLTAEVNRRIDPTNPAAVEIRHVLDLVHTAVSYYR